MACRALVRRAREARVLPERHRPPRRRDLCVLRPCHQAHRYIGKTSNYEKRVRDHIRDLRCGKHKNSHLQRWFNLAYPDGGEVAVVVLEKCGPGEMDQAETRWIATAKAAGAPLCNVERGGLGGARSEETRRKLSEISARKWADPVYRERHAKGTARRFNHEPSNQSAEPSNV